MIMEYHPTSEPISIYIFMLGHYPLVMKIERMETASSCFLTISNSCA